MPPLKPWVMRISRNGKFSDGCPSNVATEGLNATENGIQTCVQYHELNRLDFYSIGTHNGMITDTHAHHPYSLARAPSGGVRSMR
jgi:hypothetical protein